MTPAVASVKKETQGDQNQLKIKSSSNGVRTIMQAF